MNYKLYFATTLSLSLSGCIIIPAVMMHESKDVSHKVETLPFDPQMQSRIRIYYDNVNINVYENTDCTDWRNRKIKNYFNAVSSSLSNRQNLSIGMPQTKDSVAVLNLVQKGLGPKISFREYIFPANQPIVFHAHHSNVNYNCNVAANFTPKSGQDYELNFSLFARSCSLNLNQIDQTQIESFYMTRKITELSKCH